MYPHIRRRALLAVTVQLALAASVWAQAQDSFPGALGRVEQTNSNSGYYHYYVQPGTPTIQVRVLGTVAAPGLYELNTGTSLGTLLTLSGGPQLPSRERRVRREVFLRLYRPSAGQEAPVFEATLTRALTDPDGPPPLREGDILLVEVVENRPFGWREGAALAGAAAAVALAVERILSITR